MGVIVTCVKVSRWILIKTYRYRRTGLTIDMKIFFHLSLCSFYGRTLNLSEKYIFNIRTHRKPCLSLFRDDGVADGNRECTHNSRFDVVSNVTLWARTGKTIFLSSASKTLARTTGRSTFVARRQRFVWPRFVRSRKSTVKKKNKNKQISVK